MNTLFDELMLVEDGKPSPMPIQLELLERGRACYRDGVRRVIYQAPCGAGKTVIASEQTRIGLSRGRTALHIAPRRKLVDQMLGMLKRFGINAAPIMEGRQTWNSSVYCASRDTLLAMLKAGRSLPQVSWIGFDECFIGGTQILTPLGLRSIDNMRCGDKVYCAGGIGTVKTVSCHLATDLYRVEFSDGSHFVCTAGHPIFTDRGWTKAATLGIGAISYSPEGVRLLWENVSAAAPRPAAGKGGGTSDGRIGVGETGSLLDFLWQEIEEPNERPSSSTQDEGYAATNQASAFEARRQWAIAALASTGATTRAGDRMGSRSSRDDRYDAGNWLGEQLQDRRCESDSENRDRIGWPLSWTDREAGSGCEENGVLGQSRVVCVSRVEREGAVPVFNLHVSGHPSYFANGHLVHNCHVACQEVQRWYLQNHPQTFWTGYTATPVQPDGSSLTPPWQALVSMAPTSKMIELGRLVPVKVYNPDAIGQRRRKGDKVKPVGDPVEHWKRYALDLPTVAYAATISDSEALVKRYRDAGITAEHIDASTPEEEREAVFERSRNGQTKVISNVGVLIMGVDLPWLACCQILRGCSSLVLWFQAMGRVMRAFEGKEFAIGLDHSGAAHEFGLPDADFTWSLDDAKGNAKKNKPPKEGKPVTCLGCGCVFTGGPACPECGRVLPVKKRKSLMDGIKPGDGVLTRFSGEQQTAIKEDVLVRLFKKCYFIARARGRTMGAANAMFSKEAKMPAWEANLPFNLPRGYEWKTPAAEWSLT